MRSDLASRVVIPGLFAALIAAGALITVPIGAVPITLQTLGVFLVALVLPPLRAGAAVAVYVALGAVGVPVFAGAKGGIPVLLGPTGGYLFGFILGVVAGALVRRAARRLPDIFPDASAVITTLVVVYSCGWAWLAFVTGIGPVQAFVAGVAPFLLLDGAKATAALVVAAALRRAGVLAEER
jgi:biotin transport system substrate-specific component